MKSIFPPTVSIYLCGYQSPCRHSMTSMWITGKKSELAQEWPEVRELYRVQSVSAATFPAYSVVYTACTVTSTVIPCPNLQGWSCNRTTRQARHCPLCSTSAQVQAEITNWHTPLLGAWKSTFIDKEKQPCKPIKDYIFIIASVLLFIQYVSNSLINIRFLILLPELFDPASPRMHRKI